MILKLVLLHFLCAELVSASLLTLLKRDEISCLLTDKDVNTPIYLGDRRGRPSDLGVSSVVKGNRFTWTDKEWTQSNSEQFPFAPVTDERWSDFKDEPLPSLSVKQKWQLSFSVCSTEKSLQLNVKFKSNSNQKNWTTDHFNFLTPLNLDYFCSWTHLTLSTHQKSLHMTSEHNFKNLSISQDKIWLRLALEPKHSFVKKHSYKFLSANSASREASVFPIESVNGELCFSFYASVDRGSYLYVEIKVQGNVTINETIHGFNEPQGLKKWKFIKLQVRSDQNGMIYIHRKINNNTMTGNQAFWALDRIRYCQNFQLYRGYSKTPDIRCQTLDQNQRIYESLWKNKVGFFDANGTVSCSTIFGTESSHCQGYKLCSANVVDSKKCFCSWGFKGENCDQRCDEGDVGLNCIQCDPVARYCITSSTSQSTETSTTTIPKIVINPQPTEAKSTSVKTSNPVFTTTLQTSIIAKSHITTKVDNSTEISLASESDAEEDPLDFNIRGLIIISVISILFSTITGIILFTLVRKLYRRTDIENIGNEVRIDTDNFEKYLANSSKKLPAHFKVLKNDPQKTSNVAICLKNYRKNYDIFNVPYDELRVKLKPMEFVGKDDYINASYINGWRRPKAYIATQGPKATTASDFWRMIWQHDVEIIIMATGFYENLQRMSVEYFPLHLDATLDFGALAVKLVKKESREFYTKRILEIYYGRDHKVVYHYQLNFNADLGKPLYANDLVPLVKVMNENYNKPDWKPIVVHCSLGVQRTGVLILSDLAFQMAKTEGYTDLVKLAMELRKQRPNMITTEQDYLLANLVIAECIMDEKNPFEISSAETDKRLLQEQLRYANVHNLHDSIVCNSSSLLVESYRRKMTFTYSEQPEGSELIHFYRFLHDKNISVVVILDEMRRQLWPLTIRSQDDRIYRNSVESVYQTPFGCVFDIIMEETNLHGKLIYDDRMKFLCLNNTSKSPKQVPSSIENFLHLVEYTRTFDPHPTQMFVCCTDGTSACGLFMTMYHVICKYLREIEYDLPNAIRIIRRSNNDFLSKTDANLKQLDFLHRAVAMYSQKFDPYKTVH